MTGAGTEIFKTPFKVEGEVSPSEIVLLMICHAIEEDGSENDSLGVRKILTKWLLKSGLPEDIGTQEAIEEVGSQLTEENDFVELVRSTLKTVTATPHGLQSFFSELQILVTNGMLGGCCPMSVFARSHLVRWKTASYREQDLLWMNIRDYLLPAKQWIDTAEDESDDEESRPPPDLPWVEPLDNQFLSLFPSEDDEDSQPVQSPLNMMKMLQGKRKRTSLLNVPDLHAKSKGYDAGSLIPFHVHIENRNFQGALDSCMRCFDVNVARMSFTTTTKTGCGWGLVHMAYLHILFSDYISARRCVDEAIKSGLSIQTNKDMLTTCGYLTVIICIKEGKLEEAAEELIYAFRVATTECNQQIRSQLYVVLAMLMIHHPVVMSRFADQFESFIPSENALQCKEQVTATGGVIGVTLPEGSTQPSSTLPFTSDETDASEFQAIGETNLTSASITNTWAVLRAAFLQIPKGCSNVSSVEQQPTQQTQPHLQHQQGQQGQQQQQQQNNNSASSSNGNTGNNNETSSFMFSTIAYGEWATGILRLLRSQLFDTLGFRDAAQQELLSGIRQMAAEKRSFTEPEEDNDTSTNRYVKIEYILHLIDNRDFRGAVTLFLELIGEKDDLLISHIPNLYQTGLYLAAAIRYHFADYTGAVTVLNAALENNLNSVCTPDCPILFYHRAQLLKIKCFIQQKAYQCAITLALSATQQTTKVHLNRFTAKYSILVAQAYIRSGCPQQALPYVNLVLEMGAGGDIAVECSEASLFATSLYIRIKNVSKARVHFSKVVIIHLTPSLRVFYHMLAAQLLTMIDGTTTTTTNDCSQKCWLLAEDSSEYFPSPCGAEVKISNKSDALSLSECHINTIMSASVTSTEERLHSLLLLKYLQSLRQAPTNLIESLQQNITETAAAVQRESKIPPPNTDIRPLLIWLKEY